MHGCLFCKIAAGDIKAEIVDSGDAWIAFRDIDPKAPDHVLLIPRMHLTDIRELKNQDLAFDLIQAMNRVVDKLNLTKGFRIITNTGEDGGQSVPHLHFHILGNRKMGWPPG